MARAFNVFIGGQTGSGKTTLAKELVERAPRYVILDKFQDYYTETYQPRNAEVFVEFEEASEYYAQVNGLRGIEEQKEEWGIVYQGTNDASYMAFIHLVLQTQKDFDLPPMALFLEEASEYANNKNIPEVISFMYRYARRWGINIVAITQRDVMVHPIMRDNSHGIVAFKNNKLSADYKHYFGDRYDDIPHLKSLGETGPPWAPEKGTHFITHPEDMDVRAEFERVLTEHTE